MLLLALGIAGAGALLAGNDFGRIVAAMRVAGWGVLLVVVLHWPQAILSGLGFGALVGAERRVGLMWLMRWIRESVNTLLPVAQVGGDVVRVRLLARRPGFAPRGLIAASLVDVTAEMAAQLLFTIVGVVALVSGGAGGTMGVAAAALGLTAAIAAAFVAAQRFGLVRLIGRGVRRLSAGGEWGDVGADELEAAVPDLYRDRPRLLRSGAWHFASWAAGIAETAMALHVLHLPLTLRDAVAIEALGQAVRAAGFLIPGALGVQEGGYLILCAAFGIPAPQALALSLLRRVRELALGVPGLLAWQWLEWRGRGASAPASAIARSGSAT